MPPDTPLLVVLPGSRTSEVKRLMQPFGEALSRLMERGRRFEIAMPVVDSVRGLVEQHLPAWPKQPHLLEGEEDKLRAFKLARAALAASGTVTLELALAGTPMVVAYKVDAVMAPFLRRLIKAPSVVLANLVLGEHAFPEFMQQDCTAGQARRRAGAASRREPRARQAARRAGQDPGPPAPAEGTPSEAAAEIVLDYAEHGRGWPRPGLLRQ